MAKFYADEQFPFPVVEFLRELGHDVLTVREAGNAGRGIPDDKVMLFAIDRERAILTLNKSDFIHLHRRNDNHFGIIVCSDNRNWEQFATLIDTAVAAEPSLQGKLIRVVRPAS
jgi:predicted nuclease of predicted toxin-antitoxin system